MHVVIETLDTWSSQRSVAEYFNMSQSVVCRMWNCYQTNEYAHYLHVCGRANATLDIQDCYIGLLAKRNHFHNTTSLRNDFL